MSPYGLLGMALAEVLNSHEHLHFGFALEIVEVLLGCRLLGVLLKILLDLSLDLIQRPLVGGPEFDHLDQVMTKLSLDDIG